MSAEPPAPQPEGTSVTRGIDPASVAALVTGARASAENPPPVASPAPPPAPVAAPQPPPALAPRRPDLPPPNAVADPIAPQVAPEATPDTRPEMPVPVDQAIAEAALALTQPIATAQAPTASYLQDLGEGDRAHPDVREGSLRLRGTAALVASNMDKSLTVPTATSVRSIPVKLLMDNRVVANNHLERTRGGKISFTHLIAYALIEALVEVPAMNAFYAVEDDQPFVVTPPHVNMGIAIDVVRPDGARQLLVPNIKEAETLDFAGFWAAYDDVVRRARNNTLQAVDFQGTTISLTNPGTIGTEHSVPRLMVGQGTIIGVGAMDYPAEYQGASSETIAKLGISKIMALTSTYDHRVIQGALSGEFLGLVHTKLLGQDGFYDRVFRSLRVPYEPVRWVQDGATSEEAEAIKPARIAGLIHAYRSRGHLMADVDPLSSRPRKHPDLDIQTHGLTIWDLDRVYSTGGFAGRDRQRMREVLSRLRDAYCRTVGVEYMHLADRAQRAWMQDRLEGGYRKPSRDEHLRILRRLNAGEAFEAFLQTKYVGQKRFSLEGGESLIPLLDAVLTEAATAELDEVCIGMAHRGRLNVLANLAGKSYAQVFSEFEGAPVAGTGGGSGDVKYHLGTDGVFTTESGETVNVYLAANPSHLEAVNPVLEGIVRAKIDRLGADVSEGEKPVLPILIHGDAAFAGQGVVQETLNLAGLRGYRTGGTIHVIVNNQVGFTTGPEASRSTRYCTDIAKGFQIPIFHVNGDDPEACVRAARLAFEYRQEFGRDVIIDMICYRRRGHNEGDDPAMTQPRMYDLIEGKRPVRHLYAESLIRRGDITEEEAEEVSQDYLKQLERVFVETRERFVPGEHAETVRGLEVPASQTSDAGVMVGWTTASTLGRLERVGRAHRRPPEGFSVHPKLEKLLAARDEMTREGGIDWGFGEILAFGTLLQDGVPIRLAGQDSRRGTFASRHAVFHDRENGSEWTPLLYLTSDQGSFHVVDSPLSEYSALGFEYGYSVERPDALVLWEAQFGDFANGAQTILDEFISSAEQKWAQSSSVVLLLPHGFEGQGPDHSSARVERYLQMCAEENMIASMPSSPASYFHLLRRQAYARPRRPLIVFTPKSMLRLRDAQSDIAAFATGTFREVIPDVKTPEQMNPAGVTRVLMCAGKIYYDLAGERERLGDTATAIVRLEQFYPLNAQALRDAVAPFGGAELIWIQEEPQNQGAWSHLSPALSHALERTVGVISRPASASPASGLASKHAAQQQDLVARAFSR